MWSKLQSYLTYYPPVFVTAQLASGCLPGMVLEGRRHITVGAYMPRVSGVWVVSSGKPKNKSSIRGFHDHKRH